MVWPHPRGVILYARSNYYYNNMFIIYPFLTLFWIYNLFWSLIPQTLRERLPLLYVSFLDVTSFMFPSLVSCLKFTLRNVAEKQVADVSLVLKDTDTDSENLSSLIRLSVSDGQKTDSSNVVPFIGI